MCVCVERERGGGGIPEMVLLSRSPLALNICILMCNYIFTYNAVCVYVWCVCVCVCDAEWWWRQWIRVYALNQTLDEGLGNRRERRRQEALQYIRAAARGARSDCSSPQDHHPRTCNIQRPTSNIQHPTHNDPPALTLTALNRRDSRALSKVGVERCGHG